MASYGLPLNIMWEAINRGEGIGRAGNKGAMEDFANSNKSNNNYDFLLSKICLSI